jgi:LmbE family N-acetylglucosaminyl deacetylase
VAWRLAAVFAHPDDDAYGVSGTFALSAEGGDLESTVILATSGEAGPISDPSLATRENLAEVREAEERASWAAAGVAPSLLFLRYPDGGLPSVPREELVERVAEALRAARPQVVVTFGPEGITMHDDHVAIGEIATEAFHLLRRDAEPGAFQRLFYVGIPRSRMDRFWEVLREHGIDLGDPEGPFMPRGVPDETIAAAVDCRSVGERKLEAILAHRTQIEEFQVLPEPLQREFLQEEWFVQAWPEREPGGPVQRDLFEGLDRD